MDANRRTVLKGAGAAAGGALFSTTGAAADTVHAALGDGIDAESDDLQGALVVFEPGASYDALDRFDLPDGTYEMEALDIVYTRATGTALRAIASLDRVQYVEANRRIDYHNGDAQVATTAGEAQERFDLGYTGDGVHVAVIDSGVDAYHPDLQDRLRHNYQFQDPLSADTAWTDVGPADTDDIGHGTHCSGSVVGEGNRNPEHEGMAPDADLTVYSTGAGLFILNAVAAYNHILGTLTAPVEEGGLGEELHITSNSYGSSGGNDFNPAGGQERATWRAFDAGITVVSSAGNSGPGTNTLGGAKTAPHILCIAASHDGQGEGIDATTKPTSFSSRGRTANYGQQNPESEGARWNQFPNGEGGFTGEDRRDALANVNEFNRESSSAEAFADEKQPDSLSFTAGPGADASVAADGAKVGSPTYVEYTPKNDGVGSIEATISWNPPGQDLDINLRKGSEDGPVESSAASLNNPEVLSAQVDPDATYFFEIIPYAAVQATGTIDIVERKQSADPPTGPYGVYRPSVIAPGSAVVSTMGASALKALEASYGATPADTGVFYSALSGTSMSCPVTAGVTAQVIEAYYRNNGGEYPDPEEVIRLIEGGANPNAEPAYTPYNAGAGLVDAVRTIETFAEPGNVPTYEQINLAPLGDEPVTLSATGSRQDDGQVFTAGGTNQVTVTIETLSHNVDAAREQLPDGWTVVGTNEGVTKESETEVSFDTGMVNGATTKGKTAEFSFFVEAPSDPAASNQYSLGPTEVKESSGRTDTTGFVPVSGTSSTEYVAAVGTGSPL
ncbi:S8 family serine peptidase [Haloglomus halophilum]|uniref:S8 family serine peptidase n=1 Tax=Haloglomus halophilum TaxID=2962672 RepID=UPI0020CA0071|nr:S8 family serine peptidase [Haloglomus halophilum]